MDKSRSYSKIVDRLKANTYKTNRVQQKMNRTFLLKTKSRLTQKKNSNIKYKKAHKNKLEKLNAILEEIGSPGSTPLKGEVGINETLSQGDCFYSSLYRVFKERDLLKTVCHDLNLRGSTEVRFVLSFRQKVAKEVLEGKLPTDLNQNGKQENSYDFLSGLGKELTTIIDDDQDEIFPNWFKKEFRNGVGTRKNFLKKFAKWAVKRKEYVGEIEVNIVKRLLKEIGIILEIDGIRRKELSSMKDGLPLITLFNESGGHYEYFTFDLKCPKTKKRDTVKRTCV
jgi:hypothetical protein